MVSWDTDADTLDGCQEDIPTRMSRPQGSVKWTGNGNSTGCAWLIDVMSPGQCGLVFQFDRVALQRGARAEEDDTVTVYQGLWPLPANRLRHVQGDLPLAPVLVTGMGQLGITRRRTLRVKSPDSL